MKYYKYLAELVIRMSVKDLTKLEARATSAVINVFRAADDIGSNFLLEGNADQSTETGRKTRRPTTKGLRYQISMLAGKRSQLNRRLM